MRTIKFRGKRIDNGEWVYGAFYPIKNEDVYFIINNCKSIDFDDDDTTFNGYKVHKKSVGEFTGLHDKNGKEIYEGDFITYSGITSNGQKIIRVVNYNSDYARFQGGMYPLSETKNLIEVIGNVFENPELLTD